ncbi:hypothetical protein E4T49_02893 [Aureobasidium sp. EXF-10728]|nr:hypothetical protein E4T49_02893 [Aureobasidium sp. EXF-10728]
MGASIHDAKTHCIMLPARVCWRTKGDNKPQKTIDCALTRAAEFGHKDVVQLLLDHGAYIDAVETWGVIDGSALFLAVGGGHEDVVRLLIARDVDINFSNNRGRMTALCQAVTNKHTEVVKILLARGANTETTSDFGAGVENALTAAVHDGLSDITELLIAHGADVNARPGDWSPLQIASSFGNMDIVRMLVLAQADISDLLHGRHTVQDITVDDDFVAEKGLGSDHQRLDEALIGAIEAGQQEVILLLDKARTDKSSALTYAILSDIYGLPEVTKILLDLGADANTPHEEYGSILGAAYANRHDDEVEEILIAYGADVNGINDYTPLQVAASQEEHQGHEQKVLKLLRHGADIHAAGRKGTAFEQAAANGRTEIVRLLLDQGADPSNSELGAALRAASANGHELTVQLLLENGACMEALENHECTTINPTNNPNVNTSADSGQDRAEWDDTSEGGEEEISDPQPGDPPRYNEANYVQRLVPLLLKRGTMSRETAIWIYHQQPRRNRMPI